MGRKQTSDEKTGSNHSDQQKPAKNTEHAVFENGKLMLKGHPNAADIKKGIAYAQHIADLRLAENENLILRHVEKRIDEAFYTLWCGEVNNQFRLLLRYRNRAAKVKDASNQGTKESA